MRKIFFFCIPAHGHINPMLPVAKELVERGNTIRFYSFNEFKDKIDATGAEFVSCDSFLLKLNEQEKKRLKAVSSTEMTLQNIRTTIKMDSFFDEEFRTFKPDLVYTDSVCFWGKLNAWKHNVPMVVSTSTFAFNQMSSKYMKHSFKEILDMITGLPKVSKELKLLEPYGYHIKNPLLLVQSDNATDSVVYTSYNFQPYAESFSRHYTFVGPSVFSKSEPIKNNKKPQVYISLGTVINDRPDFYKKCINALGNEELDVIISCGKTTKIENLGTLPENIKIFPEVNQLDILSKADVFVSHCGMNSVSESLYMATPLVLYPQTAEQKAVARRVKEIGAGIILLNDSEYDIKSAVFEIIKNPKYKNSAKICSDDFRNCSGIKGAAEFIENAPHTDNGVDIIKILNKEISRFRLIYQVVVISLLILYGFIFNWKYIWIVGIISGIVSSYVEKIVQKKKYIKLINSVYK